MVAVRGPRWGGRGHVGSLGQPWLRAGLRSPRGVCARVSRFRPRGAGGGRRPRWGVRGRLSGFWSSADGAWRPASPRPGLPAAPDGAPRGESREWGDLLRPRPSRRGRDGALSAAGVRRAGLLRTGQWPRSVGGRGSNLPPPSGQPCPAPRPALGGPAGAQVDGRGDGDSEKSQPVLFSEVSFPPQGQREEAREAAFSELSLLTS